MFHLANGASGLLSASQVCSGAVNALRIEIYGDAGSIFWAQEEPNTMTIKRRGEPDQVLRPGANVGYLSEPAIAVCRTPAGHPEGYIEAFANLYAGFARAVRNYPAHGDTGCASVADGVATMRFIRAALISSRDQSAWTRLDGGDT
jgi:predicted dehydrogenase